MPNAAGSDEPGSERASEGATKTAIEPALESHMRLLQQERGGKGARAPLRAAS